MSPGLQPAPHQLVVRPLPLEEPEVHHDRHGRLLAGLQDAVHLGPVGGDVVGALQADDDVLVLAGDAGAGLRVHVMDVLLRRHHGHAQADDVDEGVGARLEAVEDPVAEVGEVAVPGRSGVDHGRRAGAEAEAVGQDALVAGPPLGVAGGGVEVDVDVHQAGGDVKAAHVDDASRLVGGDAGVHGGDAAPGDGHVTDFVDAVGRVDDVPAAQQQVKAHEVSWVDRGERSKIGGSPRPAAHERPGLRPHPAESHGGRYEARR